MTCPNRLESGQECGDEGRLCDSCMEKEYDKWSWLAKVPKYWVMPLDDEYYQTLKDARRM